VPDVVTITHHHPFGRFFLLYGPSAIIHLPLLIQQLRFFIKTSATFRFFSCTHTPDLAITHPSIFIDFLSNSVDFRDCPMPLGQQSITPSVFH